MLKRFRHTKNIYDEIDEKDLKVLEKSRRKGHHGRDDNLSGESDLENVDSIDFDDSDEGKDKLKCKLDKGNCRGRINGKFLERESVSFLSWLRK